MVEIENEDFFDGDHLPAIHALAKTRSLRGVQRYDEGFSGAGVYLADVKDHNNHDRLCILKVDKAADIANEIESCQRAHRKIAEAVPEIFDQSPPPPGDDRQTYRAVLLELAHGKEFPLSLKDKMRQNPDQLRQHIAAVGNVLVKWNAPKEVLSARQGELTPGDFLRRLLAIGVDSGTSTTGSRLDNLIARLHTGGVKARSLSSSARINFWGEDDRLPNPIFYALRGLDEDYISSKIRVHPVSGCVHGDFHCANILFTPSSVFVEPMLIDFAKSGVNQPLFFDWLYLEFDVLYRMSPVTDEASWAEWRRLVNAATQQQIDIREAPHESIEWGSGNQDLRDGVTMLRRQIRAYWTERHESYHGWLNAAFWLCGFYVGLNFARKNDQPGHRATFKKYAALYYAARCLKRLFDMLKLTPLQQDDAPLIGPHRYLFYPEPADYNEALRKQVYLSATDDLHETAQKLRGAYSAQFAPRPREIDEPKRLVSQMSATRRFLCIIGSQPETSDILDEPWLTRLTHFECEAALAFYRQQEDRWVLLNEAAQHLAPTHPLNRDLDTPNPDFVIEHFRAKDDLGKKVRAAMIRWDQIENKPPVDLRDLYPELPWSGLMEQFQPLSNDSRVWIVTLTGDEDSALRAMLWDWLRAQIKQQAGGAQRGLRYSPALIQTEDHSLSRDFVYHLLDAWERSKERDYRGDFDEQAVWSHVLREIERALSRVDVYLMIPRFNNYESKLIEFCQLLTARLNSADAARRVIFIVEQPPQPLAYPAAGALALNNVWIERADFEAWIDEADVNMSDFIRHRQAVPADLDWAEVLFQSKPHVSPVEFLQNFMHVISQLPSDE